MLILYNVALSEETPERSRATGSVAAYAVYYGAAIITVGPSVMHHHDSHQVKPIASDAFAPLSN